MWPRLPAEWEPQAATLLTWPHEASDWGVERHEVVDTFTALGVAISADQALLSVGTSTAHVTDIQAQLVKSGAQPDRLLFAIAPSNDVWARDHGPLTVLDVDGPIVCDFGFNGWGGKFEHDKDSAITATLRDQGVFGDTPVTMPGIVLEGGAIETDGQGTLLATRSSVLDNARNPGLCPERLQDRLTETLGFDRFLWLDHGAVGGDDTDGHIDTLARFADPDTILHATAPKHHPDHAELSLMTEQLRTLRRRDGNPYRLVPLPCPGEITDREGGLLPATYANFLLTNHSVLMPSYRVAADNVARERLSKIFPTRRVVPVDCRAIIRQNGSLHCLTMQFPLSLTLHGSGVIAKP